ncbi:MAG TPA: zf-HC2 domain-containing protein [Ktedonobacterales bacterium]|nr:zf-HC2 domain-containing protein [Ktedonobacterales bacterium]
MAIMRCRQVKGLLPAHFNKELSEADRRLLETHLATCSACHAHWHRLYRVELRLTRAPEQSQIKHGPSADFTASVMAAIVLQQQKSTANVARQEAAPEIPSTQGDEGQAGVIPPLGPWVGWNANLAGVWKPSTRVVLSGALLAIFSVMIGVIVVGVLLTQPALAAQVFTGATQALASLAAGISSLVNTLSVLADNQLLLAGVAVSYVVLAVLWFRLMRHQEYEPHPGYEEVES